MKFRISPCTGSWRLDIWKEKEGLNVGEWYWYFNSYHTYKWQAKRAAKHLATPEEVLEF